MFKKSFILHENTSPQFASLAVDRGDAEHIPIKKDWSQRYTVVTENLAENVEQVLNFEGRADDTYVVTNAKCGTTWMLETAWLILNNFDFDKASGTLLMERAPYLEFTVNIKGNQEVFDTFDMLKNMESPRLIKTHLPPSLLPSDLWKKRSRVIYVTRSMKDSLVSSYHFYRGLGLYTSLTMEEFGELFLNNKLPWHPYWDHVFEYYEMRNEPNVFFTSYERMTTNIRSVIKDLCLFLKKPIPSEETLHKAEDHLRFDNMKNSLAGKLHQEANEKEGSFYKTTYKQSYKAIDDNFEFFKKGVVGSAKHELSSDLIKRLDEWEGENLRKAGVTKEELYGISD